MTESRANTVGIAILAGGKSSRMGRSKTDMILPGDGRTMLDRICDEMSSFDCRYLSVRKGQTVGRTDYQIVEDLYDDIGPMGAICSLLTVSEADALLVLACDMPGYRREHALRMMQLYAGEEILIPETAGGYEPLAAIYSKKMLPLIREKIAEQRYKLVSVMKSSRNVRVLTDQDEKPFKNINSIEDLTNL